MRGLTILAAVCVAAGGIVACARKGAEPESAAESGAQVAGVAVAARVDDARIRNADRESGNWMSYGRTYDEQRYSPLSGLSAMIDEMNRLSPPPGLLIARFHGEPLPVPM